MWEQNRKRDISGVSRLSKVPDRQAQARYLYSQQANESDATR